MCCAVCAECSVWNNTQNNKELMDFLVIRISSSVRNFKLDFFFFLSFCSFAKILAALVLVWRARARVCRTNFYFQLFTHNSLRSIEKNIKRMRCTTRSSHNKSSQQVHDADTITHQIIRSQFDLKFFSFFFSLCRAAVDASIRYFIWISDSIQGKTHFISSNGSFLSRRSIVFAVTVAKVIKYFTFHDEIKWN